MRASSLVAAVCLVAVAFPYASAATVTIEAFDFFWAPSSVALDPGDSVAFVRGSGTHTLRFDGESTTCNLPCTRTFPSDGTFAFHCTLHPSMTGVVQVGPRPEIEVATPAPGATVQGVVAVEGSASHPSDAIAKVEVRFGPFPTKVATLTGSGGSVLWSASFDTATLANGVYTVLARATSAGGSFDTTSFAVTVANPPRQDLQVTNVLGGTSPLSNPGSAPITVLYRNNGNVPSGEFQIALEYSYKDTWRPIGTVVRPSIAASSTVHQVLVAWNSGGMLLGQFPVRATIDPANALAETDEANNQRVGAATFVHPSIPRQDLRDPSTP